ncbi:hypothetical protein M427DRAFT_27405 [Gonapodya prolifera JEL478]|uniref:Uncharacterized protein n=1 Tax=Gonapodya prolifera (strain JEL478) TaxID=1344416 RepID=A0A139AYL3_GONPJ|nr:hypothetical protein M427DRAFT_27405 [Gonapodya prolifera JEL478]|eukprot:KXS21842.1 hypothetical protein M427DRAFT_27405 [Gonapodya prolifera JEL478]
MRACADTTYEPPTLFPSKSAHRHSNSLPNPLAQPVRGNARAFLPCNALDSRRSSGQTPVVLVFERRGSTATEKCDAWTETIVQRVEDGAGETERSPEATLPTHVAQARATLCDFRRKVAARLREERLRSIKTNDSVTNSSETADTDPDGLETAEVIKADVDLGHSSMVVRMPYPAPKPPPYMPANVHLEEKMEAAKRLQVRRAWSDLGRAAAARKASGRQHSPHESHARDWEDRHTHKRNREPIDVPDIFVARGSVDATLETPSLLGPWCASGCERLTSPSGHKHRNFPTTTTVHSLRVFEGTSFHSAPIIKTSAPYTAVTKRVSARGKARVVFQARGPTDTTHVSPSNSPVLPRRPISQIPFSHPGSAGGSPLSSPRASSPEVPANNIAQAALDILEQPPAPPDPKPHPRLHSDLTMKAAKRNQHRALVSKQPPMPTDPHHAAALRKRIPRRTRPNPTSALVLLREHLDQDALVVVRKEVPGRHGADGTSPERSSFIRDGSSTRLAGEERADEYIGVVRVTHRASSHSHARGESRLGEDAFEADVLHSAQQYQTDSSEWMGHQGPISGWAERQELYSPVRDGSSEGTLSVGALESVIL